MLTLEASKAFENSDQLPFQNNYMICMAEFVAYQTEANARTHVCLDAQAMYFVRSFQGLVGKRPSFGSLITPYGMECLALAFPRSNPFQTCLINCKFLGNGNTVSP